MAPSLLLLHNTRQKHFFCVSLWQLNDWSYEMTNRDTYDILAYEEEQKQSKSGINIQVNTLIDAMIDAEKCLFRNNDSNLMPVTHLVSNPIVNP